MKQIKSSLYRIQLNQATEHAQHHQSTNKTNPRRPICGLDQNIQQPAKEKKKRTIQVSTKSKTQKSETSQIPTTLLQNKNPRKTKNNPCSRTS